MPFVFSDLMGIAWIFAFPVFLHILNYFSGRNIGITAPSSELRTHQTTNKTAKPIRTHPERFKELPIKVKPVIQIKPQIDVKPVTQARTAPVMYTPEVSKPAVTLTQNWAPICSRLPIKPKPAIQTSAHVHVIKKVGKFLKARKPRKSILVKPDKEELKALRINSGYKLKLTWIELAWLKTHAIRRGIDDWISLIDSKLSYDENKLNLVQQFGAQYTDDELMQKYQNYQDMAQDEYRNT